MANKQKLNRSINMGFRVTEEERNMIYRRMKQTKISNLRQFLLKMAIDGRVIYVELESVNECTKLLRNISNNINQIAKRANETGSIYAADIDEIKTRQNEIWDRQEIIIRKVTDMVEGI